MGKLTNLNPSSSIFNGKFKAIGTSQGGITNNPANNCGIEIQAEDSNSAAFLSFHQPGIFGAHLGLGTDSQLRFGGWSYGDVSFRIWHEGNANIEVPATSLYGSLGIKGIKNGYAGINFSGAFDSPIFMFSDTTRVHGMWSLQSAFGWWWWYSRGQFKICNSEPITTANQRGTYIALDKSTGSLPGYPGEDYPTLKTDATALYLSIAGNYSAIIGANGTYTSTSDKNKKENAKELDYSDCLKKLLDIPIYKYNFKGEDPTIQRLGCYAQDFYEKFKLGGSGSDRDTKTNPAHPSTTIALSDQIAVLMASVKALAAKVEAVAVKMESLEKKLAN